MARSGGSPAKETLIRGMSLGVGGVTESEEPGRLKSASTGSRLVRK